MIPFSCTCLIPNRHLFSCTSPHSQGTLVTVIISSCISPQSQQTSALWSYALVPPPIPRNTLCKLVLTFQFYRVLSKLFHILNQSASWLSSYSVPKIQKMEHTAFGKVDLSLLFGKKVMRQLFYTILNSRLSLAESSCVSWIQLSTCLYALCPRMEVDPLSKT